MGIKHAETGSHWAILYFPWRSAEKVTALPLDTLSSAANRMKRVHTMEKWSGLKAAELPSTQDNLISKSITSWWTSPGYIGTGVVLGRTLGLLLCACLSNASKRQISSFMIFKKGGQNNCFPIHHFRNRPFHTSDSAQYLAHEKCSIAVSQCIVVLLLLSGWWKESQGTSDLRGHSGRFCRMNRISQVALAFKSLCCTLGRVSGNPG